MKLAYLSFIVFSFFSISSEKYGRNKQFCTATFLVNRKWSLSLNEDSTFTFSIETINTRISTKPTVELSIGKWKSVGDTLKLNNGSSEINFLFQKGNKLVPLVKETETIGGYQITLDYLEKNTPKVKVNRSSKSISGKPSNKSKADL